MPASTARNESRSTTSRGEGLYLARDVVRAIYPTHPHALGDVAIVNGDTAGDSLAASLVAGSETTAAASDGETSVRRRA